MIVSAVATDQNAGASPGLYGRRAVAIPCDVRRRAGTGWASFVVSPTPGVASFCELWGVVMGLEATMVARIRRPEDTMFLRRADFIAVLSETECSKSSSDARALRAAQVLEPDQFPYRLFSALPTAAS